MILGASNLNKRFDKLSKVELRTGIGKGISFVQEAAKANAPVFDGELRSKIMTDVTEEGDTVRGVCWPAVEHGTYVELGVGPKGQANHKDIS